MSTRGMKSTPIKLILLIAALLISGVAADVAVTGGRKHHEGQPPGHGRICDRLQDLCSTPDVIYTGPTAEGHALDLLDGLFELIPLDANPDRQPHGHMIVGVGDLDNAAVLKVLKGAYDASFTVGLAGSLASETDRLLSALGSTTGCSSGDALAVASLVGFQKTVGVQPGQESGFIYFSGEGLGSDSTEQRGLDDREREFLNGRFQDVPPVPVGRASDDTCPSTENCLVELSLATTCTLYASESVPGEDGSSVNTVQFEVTDATWSVRSFDNEEDLYFIAQDFELTLAKPASFAGFEEEIASSLTALPSAPDPDLLNPSPGTTTSTTTYTSGVQTSLGGSFGADSSGKTANLTASVTISNSTTTTIPETTVVNAADLQKGRTKWQYSVGSKTETSTSFVNYWIWSYPRSAYGANQASFNFSTSSTLHYPVKQQVTSTVGSPSVLNKVPLPFSTWTPLAPNVVNITKGGTVVTTVTAGDSFVINGTGFYPATVQDVLLGGEVVQMPSVNSDTAITVIAPGKGILLSTPLSVVVRTTQGFSNTDVTITIEPNS